VLALLLHAQKPVREMLTKGSRSEEDLLKEQEEFFSRKTGGEVQPAATLATRKTALPVAPAASADAGKPMSKFALERQRKRDAEAAGGGAPENAGDRGAQRSADTAGANRAHAVRGDPAGGAAGADGVRQRIPPSKPVGEPMSVVNMQIFEKDRENVCPLAPTLRNTPAPVACHRSEKPARAGAAAKCWEGGGREGGWKGSAENEVVGMASLDEDWVSAGSGARALGTSGAHQGASNTGSAARAASTVSAAGGGGGDGNDAITDAGAAAEGMGSGGSRVGGMGGVGTGRGGQLPSKDEIHKQNKDMLGKMNQKEIDAMKKELESQIDGELLQKIRARALKKHQVRCCHLVARVLVCGNIRSFVCLCIGVSVCRCVGVSVCRCISVWVCWSVGVFVWLSVCV